MITAVIAQLMIDAPYFAQFQSTSNNVSSVSQKFPQDETCIKNLALWVAPCLF